jgi:hypothetical protein
MAAFVQEQPRVRPDVAPDREYLRYEEGFKPTQGGSYVQLPIPTAIGLDEWARYQDMMTLSEAQRLAMQDAYDRYRRVDWAFRVREAQPLWERSAQIATIQDWSMNLEAAEAVRALLDEAHALSPAIRDMETVFLTEIQDLLSDRQVPLLEIVRMRRGRMVGQMIGSPFPALNFDLDDTLAAMMRQGVDVTAKDGVAYDGIMSAWRAGAQALITQHAALRRKLISERISFPARLKRMVATTGETPEAHEFANAQYRLGEPSTQAARRLLDLNQQYVDLIAAEIPPLAGQYLRDHFNLAAYPALFPDPADMRRVFEELGGLNLTDEQRTTIEGIRSDCETTNAATLEVMKRDYLAWKEKTCIRSGFIFDEYNPYADDMQRMQQARIDKCKAAILAIETTLNPDQLNAIRGEYELWRGWLESFEKKRQAVIERHGRWPGPYD